MKNDKKYKMHQNNGHQAKLFKKTYSIWKMTKNTNWPASVKKIVYISAKKTPRKPKLKKYTNIFDIS